MPKTATRITVRLPIAERELLDAAAERKGVPTSEWVREAIREGLRRQLEIEEEEG